MAHCTCGNGMCQMCGGVRIFSGCRAVGNFPFLKSSMKSVMVTPDEIGKLKCQKVFEGVAVGWSGIVANV